MPNNILKEKTAFGFTLIELMVVVSIISLLSSVMLVRINDARKRAYYAGVAQDVRTMETAVRLFEAVKGYLPPSESESGEWTSINGTWESLAESMSSVTSIPRPFGIPSLFFGGFYQSGYIYYKAPIIKPIYSRKLESTFIYCMRLNSGFWINFLLPETIDLTENDGGADPDGIDLIQGDYEITPSC